MTTTAEGVADAALATHRWAGQARPTTAAAWLERAAEVAAILAVDQVERDRRRAVPLAEVQLLKDSGLTTVLGPVAHGGGGQRWETAYRLIREVASGDGSIGQLLAYHYLWAWAVRLVGTPAQIDAVEGLYTANNLFFGGAVNPRDGDLQITEIDGKLHFNGRKSFSTGSRVSDLTVLEGVLTATGQHIFAIVPSKQDGIVYHDDWDHLGQRLTESGGVTIRDVVVDWAGAAGYVDKVYQDRPYATLNLPAISRSSPSSISASPAAGCGPHRPTPGPGPVPGPMAATTRAVRPRSGTSSRPMASCSHGCGRPRPWPTRPAASWQGCSTPSVIRSRPGSAARSRSALPLRNSRPSTSAWRSARGSTR